MNAANKYCYIPKNETEKQSYNQQVKQKVTSNVVEINFDSLRRLQDKYLDKTPTFCSSCQSALNHLSLVKQRDGQTVWQCEFCDYVNPLNVPYSNNLTPKDSDVFYMLNKNNQKPKNDQEEESKQNRTKSEFLMQGDDNNGVDLSDERTVIFCLDNSGSMSSGTVFKDEDGTSKYMSRKACVEKAIQNQILHMQQKYPNRRVGIVLFSKEVIILGDCQAAPVTIPKDGTFEKLFELGQNHYEKLFKNKVSSIHNMAQKYKETRTSGSTALGPGLAIALGLASQSPQSGSSIILCTDGLANEGIGKLEDQKDYATYEKMGQLSKSLGILIHTVTMRGNESDVRVLGKLSDATGGRTSRVGPADFNSNFVELVKSDLVATKVEVVVQLHEGLTMIEGSPHIDLGNATENTSVTFQYAVKENYDFKGRSAIPLQSKIFFQTLQGHSMVRIITQEQKITYEKIQAVQDVQINVLARHAQKMNAYEAQFGCLEKAESMNANWDNYINNDIFVNNKSQAAEHKRYQDKNIKLTGAIKQKKQQKVQKVYKEEEMDDCEQDLFDMY